IVDSSQACLRLAASRLLVAGAQECQTEIEACEGIIFVIGQSFFEYPSSFRKIADLVVSASQVSPHAFAYWVGSLVDRIEHSRIAKIAYRGLRIASLESISAQLHLPGDLAAHATAKNDKCPNADWQRQQHTFHRAASRMVSCLDVSSWYRVYHRRCSVCYFHDGAWRKQRSGRLPSAHRLPQLITCRREARCNRPTRRANGGLELRCKSPRGIHAHA